MKRAPRPDLRPVAAKSVDELEGYAPPAGSVPEPIRAARRVPVGQLTAREAHLLLDRGQAARYVLPRTLELLEADPWLQAHYHDGDLLVTVLELDPAQWPAGTEWRERLRALARGALARAEERYDFERHPDAERRVRLAAERLGAHGAPS
jgi:hypothetical protein